MSSKTICFETTAGNRNYYYGGRRLYQYNEDDFRFKFLSMSRFHKNGIKEKLLIKEFSLITCKIVIRRKLVNNKNLK